MRNTAVLLLSLPVWGVLSMILAILMGQGVPLGHVYRSV